MSERNPENVDVGPAQRRSGDIHFLGPTLLMDRARTVRSTCYAEMYCRLADQDRGKVDMMEAKLFQRRIRVDNCPRGTLSLPASSLAFDEGRIWFHYSPDLTRFVLSYFELWGGGGGLQRSVPGGGQHREPGHWRDACVPDGIAARLASYFDRIDSDILIEVAMAPSSAGGPDAWHRRCMTLLDEAIPSPRASDDFARQVCQAHLVWIDPMSSWSLPEWSLLGRRTRVREEIENRYARSIFAGEALCRLSFEFAGMGLTGRALAWGPSNTSGRRSFYRTPSTHALLAQTKTILDAIRDGSADEMLVGGASQFLTASLMDSDLLADERRLALVRSEMTFRLAAALVRSASASSVARSPRRQGRHRDLMNRYSMLAEFVSHSVRFFGCSGPAASVAEVVDDLSQCAMRERSTLRGMVGRLCDYGASTTLIVTHFASADPSHPPKGGDVDDLSALHERLSTLAEGILAVNGSTTAS